MKLFNKIFLAFSLFFLGSFSQNSFGMEPKGEPTFSTTSSEEDISTPSQITQVVPKKVSELKALYQPTKNHNWFSTSTGGNDGLDDSTTDAAPTHRSETPTQIASSTKSSEADNSEDDCGFVFDHNDSNNDNDIFDNTDSEPTTPRKQANNASNEFLDDSEGSSSFQSPDKKTSDKSAKKIETDKSLDTSEDIDDSPQKSSSSSSSTSKTNKQGKIIILNGTSSAGKSKVAKDIKNNLKQSGIAITILSLDDFTQEELNDLDSETSDEKTEEDSKIKFSKTQNKFKKIKRPKSPLEKEHRLLSAEIKKSIKNGKNVICDLVSLNLENKDQMQYFLNKLNLESFTCLVYSSPDQLINNLNQRNRTQSPSSYHEERTPYFVLQQFPAMYHRTFIKDNAIDTITQDSILNACSSCFTSKTSSTTSTSTKTSPMKSVNKFAYGRLVGYFLTNLNFEEKDKEVYIEPVWNHYNYIFKNTINEQDYNVKIDDLVNTIKAWINS